MSQRLSVLLPVHNGQKFLRRALDSILQQSYRDFSIVAVNDGSEDDTASVLSHYSEHDKRIVVLTLPRVGLPAALNCGLEFCSGSYVARMDADDIALPHRFEKQLQFLDANPEVVAVGSFVELIDEDGWPIGRAFDKSVTHEDIVDALLMRRKNVSGICHPSVMMRTEAVKRVGGYRNVLMGEDIDLFLRLAEVGKLANIPEVLLKYRVHWKSVSLNRSEQERSDSQRVRIEAYHRLGIPLPSDLNVLKPPPPPSRWQAYRHWARTAAKNGNLRTARKYAWRLLRIRPYSLDTWKTLARALIGYPGLRVQPP